MSNQYVEPLHVVGRVLAADGAPVSNHTIHVHKRLFDKALTEGADIAYGGTLVTDAKGQFDVYCSEGDVDVVVVAVDGQSAVVAFSPTLYGVRGLVELDLVVGGEENYSGPTEYGRIDAAISALLSNTSVTYANADESHVRDLAGLSKIDPVRVSAFVLAKRMEAEAAALNLIDPDPPHYALPVPSASVFFALISSDAVQTVDEVRSMQSSARDAALVHAGERRVIEPLTTQQRGQITAFFAAMQRSRALSPGGNSATSIADILTVATVDLDNDQLRDFYDRYTQRTGSVEQFWSELHQASSFGNDQNLVKRVQFALALATVTGMNQAAVSKLALENSSSSATIAALAPRTASDWNSWLSSNDITPPASIEGSTLSERRQRYAERMASIVEHAVPTAVIKARIAAAPESNEAGALQFLSNKPEFDFAKHRFSRYVRENSINLSTLGDPATISAEMKSVQRLFSIVGPVGRIEQIRVLRANGFDSSAKIVSTGRRRFLSTMQGAGTSSTVAESIFREASRATAAAVAIYAERSQAFRRGQLPVTRDDENEFAEYSELANVFGALDACDCGECRSAFGAAAYLADLLFFVEQCDGAGFARDGSGVVSGLDALKARRPDLSRIKLSCANTNTKLPAIDLAIEALEVEVERVANGSVPDAAYDRQTSRTEAELLLEPEHRRAGAYAPLAGASKPWSLPYHRETDAALSFLSLSGVKPADFIRAVSLEGSLDRWQLARLELAMSGSEFTLLASDNATTPKTVWGYEDAIPSSMQLRTFLRRTSCSLEEAQQIIACQYPNQGQLVSVPGSGGALKITITNCSLDDAGSTVDNLYTERARRIYRMVRLQRRTGLDFAELDVILAALGEPSTPPSYVPADSCAMVRFAEARAIQRRSGFTAQEVAAIAQTAINNDARMQAFARVLGLSATDEAALEASLGVSNTDSRIETDPFGWAEDQLARMRAFVDGRVAVNATQAFLLHKGVSVDASAIDDAALEHSWSAIRAAKSSDAEPIARVINEEGARLLRAPQDAVEYLFAQCIYGESAYFNEQITTDSATEAPAYFKAGMRRAAKLMQMRAALGVEDDALVFFLRWLKRRMFSFAAIPLTQQSAPSSNLVDNIVEAARANVLGDMLGRSSADVYRVLAEIPEMGAGVVTPEAFVQRLASLFGEPATLIDYVTDKLSIKPSPYVVYAWQSTRGIDRVRQALRVMKATGATQLDAMQTWSEFNSQAIADAIRAAIQSKLGESAYRDAATPVAMAMRERQRDALVAYLVAALELSSADELYTRLLVDVEMSPCMLTTRVLQATSCVQNILHRASMNLDLNAKWSTVSGLAMARPVLSTDDARTLGWMKNYRVWEAARRVLLYPENYLEPELRVDATPAFDDLSRALEQGELDERATEDALRVYLRSLEEVSSLDVCAMTVEPRSSNHKIFHVFGRSRTSPRTYHYCRYDSHEGWTAWQPTKLDVGEAHIVPVVFGGRLYVYWPMFAEKEIVGALEPVSETQSRPKKRWDIRIAGARLEDGRWTQAFVSDIAVKTHEVRAKHEYSIRPEVVGSTLSLSVCVAQSHHDERQPMTDFELCHGVLLSKDGRTFTSAYGDTSVVWRKQYSAPPHTERYESRLVNDGVAAVLSIPYLDDTGAFIARADVMAQNELRFALVQPVEALHFVGAQPFFYVDSERVYFMLPSPMYRLRASEVGSPSRVTPESAERLLGSHDRSGVLSLSNVPRIGGVGSGVYSGPMRNIAVDPRTLSANAGRGRYEIPADISANLGLVVRREPNTSIGSRSSLVGFDTGAVVQGLLSPNPSPSPTLTQSPLRIQATRFDHPFVGRLRAQLERFGVDAIYAPPAGSDLTLLRQQTAIDDFVARYQPTTAIASPMPIARFDLQGESPSSAYNWELFFFAPWAIANRLRAQQKFEQAFRWMRFGRGVATAARADAAAHPRRHTPVDGRDATPSRNPQRLALDGTNEDGCVVRPRAFPQQRRGAFHVGRAVRGRDPQRLVRRILHRRRREARGVLGSHDSNR
ncbi:MAG: neuraminidase-like domain-containing protein [Polyangiales bacterium]